MGGEAEGWLWVRAGRDRYRQWVGFRVHKKKWIGGGDWQQESVFCHISIVHFVLGPPVRSISSVGCKVETHPTVDLRWVRCLWVTGIFQFLRSFIVKIITQS
jgi:hypothetical protein